MSDTADTAQRTLDLTRIPTFRAIVRRILIGGALGAVVATAAVLAGLLLLGTGDAGMVRVVVVVLLIWSTIIAIGAVVAGSVTSIAPFRAREAYAAGDDEKAIARAVRVGGLEPRLETTAAFVGERQLRLARAESLNGVLTMAILVGCGAVALAGGASFGPLVGAITGVTVVLLVLAALIRWWNLRLLRAFVIAHPLPAGTEDDGERTR